VRRDVCVSVLEAVGFGGVVGVIGVLEGGWGLMFLLRGGVCGGVEG